MSEENSSKQLGTHFEEYVVREIAPLTEDKELNVRFEEWRGDKHLKGVVSPRSSSKPDLEFKRIRGERRFGFECKFRSNWCRADEDYVRVVDEDKAWKLDIYHDYAKEGRTSCYIVLGVEWDQVEKTPKGLYMIPMLEVTNLIISKSLAERYLCNNIRLQVQSMFGAYMLREDLRAEGILNEDYIRKMVQKYCSSNKLPYAD